MIHTSAAPSRFFFFLNDPAPTDIYPLPLHAPLPISPRRVRAGRRIPGRVRAPLPRGVPPIRDRRARDRSEEHTSELQSQSNLVCRLLLEKKKIDRSILCSPPHTSTYAARRLLRPGTS